MGLPPHEAVQFSGRERRVLLTFGFFSFFYNLALPLAILWFAVHYLMDWFLFPGLLAGVALAVAFAARPLKKTAQYWFGKENRMAVQESARRWRRFVPAAIALMCLAILLMPWTASVGSYGTLVAIPGRESVIRAPEDSSLVVVGVQPGQQVAAGAAIAQMANLDMDEQIAEVRTELARVEAEAERLAGERRMQQEIAATAQWQLSQRRREFNDIDGEQQQIRSRFQNGHPAFAPVARVSLAQSPSPAGALPPALAAMEAEADRVHAEWSEANRRRERARVLSAQGILSRSELDLAEQRAASLSSELAGARQRLSAALIEHERRHASVRTDLNVAGAHLSTAQAHSASLALQLEANRRLRDSLIERLSVLNLKRAQFAIPAPRAGTLFGDDLPRMLGQYFLKGQEICRIADIGEVLVRIQVGEEALSDIRLGQSVRVKTRAFPDRLFRGVVSKVGGESEAGQDGRRTYRLEFTIKNEEGLLRPGMTVFARADFGRRPIGWLLVHKLKQSLRPELWML
jgi:multidrug resistance efflux pump